MKTTNHRIIKVETSGYLQEALERTVNELVGALDEGNVILSAVFVIDKIYYVLGLPGAEV